MPPKAGKSTPAAVTPAERAGLQGPGQDTPAARRWRVTAVAILAVLAASASLTRIWNFDIFWHLAAGDWMLRHHAVLGHDPFGPEATTEWVNIHWLFQVVTAGLHALGGFAMLSIVKCLLATGTVFTFAWGLRRRVPPGWLILGGIALLAVMSERIRLRPELFTCLFVMLTVMLLEGVRLGGAPRRLWWLVPLMLVWVNSHGLYFFGIGLIWSAVAGSWLDRRLRRPPAIGEPGAGLLGQRAMGPILAATVACLISPWPVQAAAHPLLLWTRVSRQAIAYTYGVSELQPTWEALGSHWPAVAVVGLVVLAMVANRRRVPAAHVVWLLAFAFMGLLARRNVGLIAPVCGYLLAWHGAGVLRGLAARGPAWQRTGRGLTWAATAAGVLLSAGYVTEIVPRLRNSTERFGVGLLEQNYPIDTAKFLRDLDAEGEVYCENFGDAAVFIYYTTPRRKVWMDGRLEVHSVERFAEQTRIANELRTKPSASSTKLPDTVRFLVVGHQASEALSSMMESDRFRLIHVEPMYACFARTDYRPQSGLPDRVDVPNLKPNLADHDRPLTRDYLVEGFGVERRRWFRQNPPPKTYWTGAMMFWLGRLDSSAAGSRDPLQHRCTLLAMRYLRAGGAEALVPKEIATGMLAWAMHQRSLQLPVAADDDLPVDPNLARSLYLYQQLDLSDLSAQTMRAFAERHVHALVYAGQFDVADRAIADLLERLPPAQRVNPPRDYLVLRGTIAEKLAMAQVELASPGLRGATPLQRARAMVDMRIGTIDQAIGDLASLGSGAAPEVRTFLGDLYLRRGQPAKARAVYQDLVAGDARPIPKGPSVRMRLALCDWVEGRLFEADDALARLAAADRPVVGYCRALLLEQLGRYDEARSALVPVGDSEAKLKALVDRIRGRLQADHKAHEGH